MIVRRKSVGRSPWWQTASLHPRLLEAFLRSRKSASIPVLAPSDETFLSVLLERSTVVYTHTHTHTHRITKHQRETKESEHPKQFSGSQSQIDDETKTNPTIPHSNAFRRQSRSRQIAPGQLGPPPASCVTGTSMPLVLLHQCFPCPSFPGFQQLYVAATGKIARRWSSQKYKLSNKRNSIRRSKRCVCTCGYVCVRAYGTKIYSPKRTSRRC